MSATGEAPRRKKGGAWSRPCACGCGVCTREFGLQLTVRRTQGGDRDLLKPLLGSMSKAKRRRICKALGKGKSGGYISAVHVHPDDLFWTDGLQISKKRGSSSSVVRTPHRAANATRSATTNNNVRTGNVWIRSPGITGNGARFRRQRASTSHRRRALDGACCASN